VAAPTYQAEGALAAVAVTGPVSPTIPTHQADDILLLSVVVWAPDTVPSVDTIPTPSGWTLLGSQVQQPAGTADGWMGLFWKRATDGTTTVSPAAGANWDLGIGSGVHAARVDVIRGCITTGTPFDTVTQTGPHTTANQATPTLTVLGTERLGICMGLEQDNLTFITSTVFTADGWTGGTATTTAIGSDAQMKRHYIDGVSANKGPYTPSTTAPAVSTTQTAYAIWMFAAVPPAAAVAGRKVYAPALTSRNRIKVIR